MVPLKNVFLTPTKEYKSTTLMLEQKKNTFEIIETFLITWPSLVFYYVFKTLCFVSNMKIWQFSGDFKALIKNRKAMRDAKEKTGVCKVARILLKIPKLSSFFMLTFMVTELYSFEFYVNLMVQVYKLPVFSKYALLICIFTIKTFFF